MRRKPILSRAGNPFPPQLKPVRMDKADWSPLTEDMFPKLNLPSRPYVYETFGPDEPQPPLRLPVFPRHPGQTDAQYEFDLRDDERFWRAHNFRHGLCQELCTLLGNHRTCKEGVCRRKKRCVARRDEDSFGIPEVIYPPCIPLDIEIMETYRMEVGAELRRWDRDRAAPDGAREPPITPDRAAI